MHGYAECRLGDHKAAFAKLRKGCHVGIIVIGETGSVNNLVGKNVVEEGYSLTSETSTIYIQV